MTGRDGKLDLINIAQWLIAGASLLLLLAIYQREQDRDELRVALTRRAQLERDIQFERERNRARFDGMLDEINRLKGTNATTGPAEPELVDPDAVE